MRPKRIPSSAAAVPQPASSITSVTPPAQVTPPVLKQSSGVQAAEAAKPAAVTVPTASSLGAPSVDRDLTVRPPLAQTAPGTRIAQTVAGATARLAQFFDVLNTMLPGAPANPVSEFLAGALLLVRRTLLPDVPTIPVVTVSGATVAEGTTGDPQRAVFTVTLGAEYDDPVTIRYATADLTATAGIDYTPVSGALVFAPGQTSQQVSVDILPDSADEAEETFALDIFPAEAPGDLSSVILAAGTGVITNLHNNPATTQITFPELDSPTSPFAVRVDPTQQNADAIKVDAGTTITLTLPGPATSYTVLANKPTLVDITSAADKLTLTAKTPGFLGLSVKSEDGTAARYLGLYVADPATHIVPDTVAGYLPVGSVTSPDTTGDTFLENFNFRDGVAPIDYLYIYDQGGADYTDGNLRGLLTQAVRHGLVPVVVYYNIQAVSTAAGSTGIVEGPNSAFQAINDYNWSGSQQHDPNMFTGYMQRYFTKMATDFTTMNNVGVPVQIVMEPDFLGYMASALPDFKVSDFVPDQSDRTLNTANVAAIYDAGLLTRGTDPTFTNTVAGLVESINYYVGNRMPNLRIGWKTNIWAVANQQNWSLGLMHMTDPVSYPWQGQWSGPAPTWDEGRTFITQQAAGLGAFLQKVGVTSWSGSPDRVPFIAIDKYGVDGAYTYDPQLLGDSQTAAFGNLSTFIAGSWDATTGQARADITDAQTLQYYGLTRDQFATFYKKYNGIYDKTAPDVRAVFTTLQNAAVADPNLAMWFFNADQWNNYLLLVKTLSTTLDGTKVMLWQIPQGHINGSVDLPNSDLTNTVANFEDSATSYFFGDTFTAPGGRLTHFGANQAADPGVTVNGNTVTWGEHMTLATESGALSVLFGAGLGISTRGSVTPAGGVNDHDFWSDKATGYLSQVGR